MDALSGPLKIIETALNKLLRKLWNLPRNSHTSIVHSVDVILFLTWPNGFALCTLVLCHLHQI